MSARAKYEPKDFTCVTYEVADHIAVVMLNRPERRNALNRRAFDELESAFAAIDQNPDVRCVVVTGADPAFCSGDDVGELMNVDAPPPQPVRPDVRVAPTAAAMAVLDCDRPVIAAINGAAVGWGMELALFADIRIASDKAKFAELFIKRGLISDVGGFYRLPSLVGPDKAAELLFTGDVIDAAEAHRIGLVGTLVPHAELISAAIGVAKRIAVNPPVALRYMKEGLRRTTHGDPREISSWAIEVIRRLKLTEDHREGVKSFTEKRPAVFTGR